MHVCFSCYFALRSRWTVDYVFASCTIFFPAAANITAQIHKHCHANQRAKKKSEWIKKRTNIDAARHFSRSWPSHTMVFLFRFRREEKKFLFLYILIAWTLIHIEYRTIWWYGEYKVCCWLKKNLNWLVLMMIVKKTELHFVQKDSMIQAFFHVSICFRIVVICSVK